MTDRPTFTDPRVAGAAADLDGDDDTLITRDRDDIDPLAALAEIADPVQLEERTMPHRHRPGWAARYSITVDFDDVKLWQKAAKARGAAGKRGEIDEIRFACIVLGNLNTGMVRNGAELVDGDGEAVTFRSHAMRQTYGVTKVADVVRKFYSNDPYLVATADTLLAEAGVGEEVEMVDPTNASGD